MTNSDDRRWHTHDWIGSAGEFHAREVSGPRSLWLCTVTAPALVLGSSQSESDVDPQVAERSHIEIAHRRTGGGAVYLHPADSIWIDVTIERDDPLWVDDVSASMMWLGEAFVGALSGWTAASVHTGSFDAADGLGKVVCFASAAPGEVFVGDKKLVGISQRRGRAGARFQCVIYRSWRPEDWCDLFTDAAARQKVSTLPVATIGASGREVMDALVDSLPA